MNMVHSIWHSFSTHAQLSLSMTFFTSSFYRGTCTLLYLVHLFTDLSADIDKVTASQRHIIHVCDKLPFKIF